MDLNVQEEYLEELIDTGIKCAVFLTNGIKLDGSITSQDDSVIGLKFQGKVQLVYKHAISTVGEFVERDGNK